MDDGLTLAVSVSEFVDLLNQTFEFAFPSVVVAGELANFKVSRNRWVFFDLKDDEASVRCFGTVQHLPGPLEDGMLLHVRAQPKMSPTYGFSLNVQTIQPAGEGAIKRAAQLLTAKLQAEGLFDETRKRPLPYAPERIGLITSAQSAAYANFIKILGARWGGVDISLVDVSVQGDLAPEQIVTAIERFNLLAQPPEVLILIRGGGSADDLAAFSTEQVTRAVAASRIPMLVAIGHEIDTSLAELAADRRASTPSHAAELLVPDKQSVLQTVRAAGEGLYETMQDHIADERLQLQQASDDMSEAVTQRLRDRSAEVAAVRQLLEVLSPRAALKRGYAVVRCQRQVVRSVSQLQSDDTIQIELADGTADAVITNTRPV